MEPNQDDPGLAPEVISHVVPVSADKDLRVRLIINKAFAIYQELLWYDPHRKNTEVRSVPEVLPEKVQPKRRGLFVSQPRTPQPKLEEKRCWTIGKTLFDAMAHMPQQLFIASNGIPYCSFVKLGKPTRYEQLTPAFLNRQSDSVLSSMLAELHDEHRRLLKKRAKGKKAA